MASLSLCPQVETNLMSNRKVIELLLQLKSAKPHGKNYIKVKPHLVRVCVHVFDKGITSCTQEDKLQLSCNLRKSHNAQNLPAYSDNNEVFTGLKNKDVSENTYLRRINS